mmetsp:Transcript_48248/g.154044  ORF Transcript_48248/g.154044 Transcript_48248/m.154044 type:complete len:397 (-) Transcript_48248:270-1460(-)
MSARQTASWTSNSSSMPGTSAVVPGGARPSCRKSCTVFMSCFSVCGTSPLHLFFLLRGGAPSSQGCFSRVGQKKCFGKPTPMPRSLSSSTTEPSGLLYLVSRFSSVLPTSRGIRLLQKQMHCSSMCTSACCGRLGGPDPPTHQLPLPVPDAGELPPCSAPLACSPVLGPSACSGPEGSSGQCCKGSSAEVPVGASAARSSGKRTSPARAGLVPTCCCGSGVRLCWGGTRLTGVDLCRTTARPEASLPVPSLGQHKPLASSAAPSCRISSPPSALTGLSPTVPRSPAHEGLLLAPPPSAMQLCGRGAARLLVGLAAPSAGCGTAQPPLSTLLQRGSCSVATGFCTADDAVPPLHARSGAAAASSRASSKASWSLRSRASMSSTGVRPSSLPTRWINA